VIPLVKWARDRPNLVARPERGPTLRAIFRRYFPTTAGLATGDNTSGARFRTWDNYFKGARAGGKTDRCPRRGVSSRREDSRR
jgi:hypothetical protein